MIFYFHLIRPSPYELIAPSRSPQTIVLLPVFLLHAPKTTMKAPMINSPVVLPS